MSIKYDDEIREVEARLVRDRHALVMQAEALSERARHAAASPKGLLTALAIGFLLGEITAPRRPRRSAQAQAVDATKKAGIGGLIGSALFAYVRSQYGSPAQLARTAWDYYVESARARREARVRSAAPSFRTTTDSRSAAYADTARASPSAPTPTATGQAISQPIRTPERHVAS